MHTEIIREVNLFLKVRKTEIVFYESPKTTQEMINAAINDPSYPFILNEPQTINDLIVLSAHSSTLEKTIVVLKPVGADTAYRAYFTDEFVASQTLKRRLKNADIHSLLNFVDKRYHIAIPFALKDDLKATIPTAKFDGDKRTWHVGSRSGKKISLWIEDHEDVIRDFQTSLKKAKEEKSARLAQKICLKVPYDFKDSMKAAFPSLEYGERSGRKNWFIDPADLDQANTLLSDLEIQSHINDQSVTDADTLSDVLNKIKSIMSDFVGSESLEELPFGLSIYRYHGNNPAIQLLAKTIRRHLVKAKKDKMQLFSEKSIDKLKVYKKSPLAIDSMIHFVLINIGFRLDKALLYCDENDCKIDLWVEHDDAMLNWIAERVLCLLKLDQSIEIDFL